MIKDATDKGGGGMTGRAIQAGRNMIVRHATCGTTMAGSAVVYDVGVIERGGREGCGVVTDTTILIGLDMIDIFGFCKTGCMTGAAVIHDAGMLKRGGYKTCRYVTVAAIIIGGHMVVILAIDDITVVT